MGTLQQALGRNTSGHRYFSVGGNSDDLRNTACLILDVRMPGMSGIELHRHLVANHSEIPVVFITAHGFEQETRLREMRDGAVDYLRKPFSADALLNAVRKALG
jgi:FixJ family two-component response regulator